VKEVLHSELLRISALNPDDASTIAPWFARDEFSRFYDTEPAVPQSDAEVRKTIEEYNADEDKMMLGVRLLEDDRLVGVAGFTEILWYNQVGTIFVGLGDTAIRGKGLAREAMALLIDYAFDELNLHRIQLMVVDYNEAAIKLYEKLGFVREGTYREFGLRDGKYYDQHLYGLLKQNWNT